MAELIKDCSELSLQEAIGQTIMVRASGYLFDYQRLYPAWEAPNHKLQYWLQELNIGGVIFLGGSTAELAARSQQLQAWAKTPLLIAADIEEGVGQRFTGATWFPPPMALGAIYAHNPNLALEYAERMGAITAQEALATGVNFLFAPVVDVNNNPDNPVINVRSFGDRPEIISDLAAAFMQGAQQYPILTTAKHFPGHGDTAIDSHLDLPVLSHNNSRLTEIELPPFQKAIEQQVDAVMTAHLSVPAWDRQYPVTLSYNALTAKLRHQLGFQGLIVTDALIMGGITQYAQPEEVAVRAIEAGADILLMPQDPEVAIQAVSTAVASGRLNPERIYESVRRIYQAKQKVFASPISSAYPPFPGDRIAQPQALKIAAAILTDSLQTNGCLPVSPPQAKDSCRSLIVVDDAFNCPYLDRHTPAVKIPQALGYQVQLLDRNTLMFGQQDDRKALLQVFIRANPFRGSAGLTSVATEFYQQLIDRDLLQGAIIYGSPYILNWFRSKFSHSLPWVFSYGQMPTAQAIALQTMFGLSRFDDKNYFDFGF